jgi:hypothetical protein
MEGAVVAAAHGFAPSSPGGDDAMKEAFLPCNKFVYNSRETQNAGWATFSILFLNTYNSYFKILKYVK